MSRWKVAEKQTAPSGWAGQTEMSENGDLTFCPQIDIIGLTDYIGQPQYNLVLLAVDVIDVWHDLHNDIRFSSELSPPSRSGRM